MAKPVLSFKETVIECIKDMILSEYEVNNSDWAEMAARKIYTYIRGL